LQDGATGTHYIAIVVVCSVDIPYSNIRIGCGLRQTTLASCFTFCRFCRLVEEVHEIGDTLEQLQAKMVQVEEALKKLHETRQTLEYDLSVKNNSIHVDRELCLSWRKSYDMSPRRSIYY